MQNRYEHARTICAALCAKHSKVDLSLFIDTVDDQFCGASGLAYFGTIERQNEALQASIDVMLAMVAQAIRYGEVTLEAGEVQIELDMLQIMRNRGADAALVQDMARLFGVQDSWRWPPGMAPQEDFNAVCAAVWVRLASAIESASEASWRRVRELLEVAITDPVINTNTQAVKLLQQTMAAAATTAGAFNGDQEPMRILLLSSIGKRMREARTKKVSSIKDKALELYGARKWKSLAAAAKSIFPKVREFETEISSSTPLSADRFEKTLREWVKEKAK